MSNKRRSTIKRAKIRRSKALADLGWLASALHASAMKLLREDTVIGLDKDQRAVRIK